MRPFCFLLLLFIGLPFAGIAQTKWSAYLSMRKEIGGLNTIDPRIDFIINPELQLERVITRGSLVTKLTTFTAIQHIRAEDSHFYWEFTNLEEDYDLKNWLLGLGVLSATRPNLKFQVLGGLRLFMGLPLRWEYEMTNLLVDGTDLITGQTVDPQNYPSRITTSNGLQTLWGWQVSMGGQYEIARRLFVRSLFSFGNSQQFIDRQTLASGTLTREKISGLGNSLSIGLAYEW